MNVIKIKKTHELGKIPTKAHPTDAGWDMYVAEVEKRDALRVVVNLGISVEIPHGYMLQIVPRSSISKTGWMLANSVGIVDEDYRGEIKVVFAPSPFLYFGKLRYPVFPYKVGDRCAQCFLVPVIPATWEEAELSDTERGTGGFGSTGK